MKKKISKSSLSQRRKDFNFLLPLASLRLTITLLSLSMILIFVATLEQVRIGIRGALAEYFESFYGIWYYPEKFWGSGLLQDIPLPIPGGYLLGGLLIINLSAAYIVRFQWTLKKGGIQLIHLGIILLLIGQLTTQAIQEESRMLINKGDKSNYIERFHGVELSIRDVTNPAEEKVITVPQALLEKGGSYSDKAMPFTVNVLHFGVNCDFDFASAEKSRSPMAKIVNRGVGQSANLNITSKEEDFSSDALNFGYIIFELLDKGESLGKWMSISHPAGNQVWSQMSPKLSDMAFQTIRHNGRLWGVALRQEREYLPFSIELLDIENEYYQGTEIPFNFESDVNLHLEGNQTRRALVYMNTPLRHGGLTFYQYQMNDAANYSVFQVINNPSWLVPYIACILVSIGMLWQFSFHLVKFLRKNSKSPANA
ncbi:cytochrome c biogenesis protein ResB [Opitutales bacterium]|nr:cytochrome c biogenesis protein ResB [Opitutales bacterium]